MKLNLEPQIDERGIRLSSDRFRVGVVFGNAGSFTDQAGQVKNFDKYIKITSGDFTLKLSPLAFTWLKSAMCHPCFDKELSERASLEKQQLLKELEGFSL